MSVLDDIPRASDWIAGGLGGVGYVADYTVQSAREVDRFYDEHMDGPRQPRSGGLFADQLGAKLFALGAYVGEVIRRNSPGWYWAEAPDDPEDEINVMLRRDPAEIIWPMQRVIKRYSLGREEGIAAYVTQLARPRAGSSD